MSADDVIHAYIETILPQIGPSRFILTDNRTEFKNDTMNSVTSQINVLIHIGRTISLKI